MVIHDDEDREFLLRTMPREYERARQMGLPEPTWLPEETLMDYAGLVGINRRPRTDPDHVRARLKNFRRARGMTQKDLAQHMGISQSAVSRFERGRRAMRLHQLTRLAEALRVPLDDLVRPPHDD